MFPTKTVISLTGFATMLCLSAPAHAYLDPATGSIILQVLIGGVATATLYFRTSLYRIKEFFQSGSDAKAGKKK